MTPPFLLAAGGAHIDRRGRVAATYVPGASNPGTMREETGGGAFNALGNAVRRGVAGALLSVRGGDPGGETVARDIAAAGIEDLSSVFLDRATPSYTALIDDRGELIAGLADMALYEAAFPKLVRRRGIRDAAARADALLCDANMPGAALETLAALNPAAPLFAIAVSPAKAIRLKPVLARLDTLFMTGREARALAGLDADAPVAEAAKRLRAAGLGRGVVTQGGAAVLGFDGGETVEIAPPAPRAIADVTGAGDALCGAMVAALMQERAFADALREGLAAALLTIESDRAVADWSQEAFAGALSLVGQPRAMA